MKKTLLRLLGCLILILFSCENDSSLSDAETDQAKNMLYAKTWFDHYKAKEEFHPAFKNIDYYWENASIIKLENDSKAIAIPIKDNPENPDYKGKKMLYLYQTDSGYDAVVHEIFPKSEAASYVENKKEDFKNLDSFSGYILTWNLKEGFVKGAEFEDGLVVKNIPFAAIFSDNEKIKAYNLTHKAPSDWQMELDNVIVTGGSGGGGCGGCTSGIRITPTLGGGGIGGGTGDYIGFSGAGGGSGSGGGSQPIGSPCNRIKEQLTSANFIAKQDELKKKTNLKIETGYLQSKNGPFTALVAAPGTASTDELHFSSDANTIGYMHTHLDPYDKVMVNGDIEPVEPIRMFSPDDVKQFLILVLNAQRNNIPVSEVYGTVVSSKGTYQLRFTGNVTDITAKGSSINWGTDLDKIYKTYLKGDKELGVLQFLNEKIGINGIELYKIEATGNSRKTLDPAGKVTSINCN